MGTKILQSFNPYSFGIDERRLPDGTVLPAVQLPKAKYRPQEVYLNGPRRGQTARPVVELNDLEQLAVLSSPLLQSMFDKGTYRWLDHVPESLKSVDDLVSELRAENAALKSAQAPVASESSPDDPALLRARIAALEAENSALVSENKALEDAALVPPAPVVQEPVVEPAEDPVEVDPEVLSPREELLAKPEEDLQIIAMDAGVENVYLPREELVDAILAAKGYGEVEAEDPSDPS